MEILIWGDYACFTRPELKAEPFSYDYPTFSAITGVLENIYWKPEMKYKINSILVCNPVKRAKFKINGIQDGAKISTISGILADDHSVRTQRNLNVLRDVRYVVDFELDPLRTVDIKKHNSIIYRRIEKGQYYYHPCLGFKKFPAYFSFPIGDEKGHPSLLDEEYVALKYLNFTANKVKPEFAIYEIKKGKICCLN